MAAKTPTKKKTRPRVPYLTYEEAKAVLHAEMIPSRKKYDDWYEINKPKVLPRFPNRVYKEWTTWNEFLGNDNLFKGSKKSWRDIDEATMYIHTLKIPTQPLWMEWVKIPGNLPDDIPARPDLTYSKWISWKHWLGNSVTEAAQARQEAQKIQIFYLVQYPDVPGNVITVGVENMGIAGMKEMWERKKYNIIGLFWFDTEKYDAVRSIIENNSTPYLGINNQRIIPNTWDVVWNISLLLDKVNL